MRQEEEPRLSENERERAQLERAEENTEHRELALVVVEVAGRDHEGRINQFRGMREATAEDAARLAPGGSSE